MYYGEPNTSDILQISRSACQDQEFTREQDAADHPWYHHEEHGQQLQVPTQEAATLHMKPALSCQEPLDRNLPGEDKWVESVLYEGQAASAQVRPCLK